MKICVVGSGYVGLVTGACLADFGMDVTGVDKDTGKVERLGRGEIPIFEPGLATLVRKNMEQGRLRFTTDLGPAVEEARAVFIAVGTPPRPDGSADLKFIRQVAESIGEHLNGYKAIITKSTVPTGTGAMVEEIVREKSGGRHEFAVVSNPEFLREGSAIEDFRYPDRVVIGSRDPKAIEIMHQIYAPLKRAKVAFVDTDVETAEMIKYASNGFLATKISFINEMANLCEAYGADVETVARGMGLDERIGPRFLHPGPGFGGSCFPKDTRAVSQIAHERGLRFRIIDAVLEVNTLTQDRMVEKVRHALGGEIEGKTVAALGLAFKANTDDVRETPALPILGALHEAGAKIRAYDPEAMGTFQDEFPHSLEYCDDEYQAAEGADALLILTDWNQFRALEFGRMRQLLARPLVIDLRNLYEIEAVTRHGLRYVSVGRPDGVPESAT
ncbi:MAG: UDP-glucose/GDP-mannose dehydrogenase family protein [Acidobacteriota bacterium]